MAFKPKEKPAVRKNTGSSKGGNFEAQANSIRVFKNDSDNEKAPAYTGVINLGDEVLEAILDGATEIRVALWKVTTQSGKRFLAGTVSLPFVKDEDERPARSTKKPAKKQAADWDDEDGEDEEY